MQLAGHVDRMHHVHSVLVCTTVHAKTKKKIGFCENLTRSADRKHEIFLLWPNEYFLTSAGERPLMLCTKSTRALLLMSNNIVD